MRARAAAVLATAIAVFLTGALTAPARAADASPTEVLELAERAADEEAALQRLRRIDSIDGRPVDIRRLIRGAEDDQVVERIETLIDDLGDAATDPNPGEAREQARAILRQERFRPTPIPRPLRGVLEAVSAALEPIGDALTRFFDWIATGLSEVADATPGGANTLWFLLGGAVVVAAVLYTRRVVARRSRAGLRARTLRAAETGDDPRELEREARAAEERGDHDLAVRLRFRAGLLRLDAARVIPARDSLTTGDVRKLLRSPTFDRIGSTFDAIAYGGRHARPRDSAEARSGWERVLEEKVRS